MMSLRLYRVKVVEKSEGLEVDLKEGEQYHRNIECSVSAFKNIEEVKNQVMLFLILEATEGGWEIGRELLPKGVEILGEIKTEVGQKERREAFVLIEEGGLCSIYPILRPDKAIILRVVPVSLELEIK